MKFSVIASALGFASMAYAQTNCQCGGGLTASCCRGINNAEGQRISGRVNGASCTFSTNAGDVLVGWINCCRASNANNGAACA